MASFYPSVANKSYVNVFYAVNIALDTWLSDLLLNGDSSRIVYASTDYALIKRSGTASSWSNANLPFINYRQDGKEQGGDRPWFSMEGYSQGLYIPELRKKLRITPIVINYDSTYWTSRDDDFQYATDMLMIDASAETKLQYDLDFGGTIVKNIAVVNMNLDTGMKFSEQDFLEQNDIRSIGLNPSIQTWLPKDTTSGFCIPKKVLLNFCLKKGIGDDSCTEEELLEFTIDHFNQKVV